MKVEIFCSHSLTDLENLVNDFIEELKSEVHDIKFSSCFDSSMEQVDYSAMIIYKT